MAGLAPFDLDKKFTLSQVPHPAWKPQNSQGRSEHAVQKVALDPQEIGPGNSYKLLIGGVVPRPIAFVSTRSKTGLLNLAPFSFFNVVCNDPPTVAISIAMAGGHQKDTATNILDSGEFVVNIISEWFAEAANYTSIDAPPGQSEFQLSGLTPIDSLQVQAPRVKESAYQMECKLVHHLPIINKEGKTTFLHIIGEICMFHIDDDVVDTNSYHVSLEKLRPLSRLGGISYGRTTEGYEIPRPKWEEEKEKFA
ncbi:hypothetical protein K450DRAFT_236828 [Umbelopsis ramanniana AG]|uniref:Flavin reductase like domain-containing protein n=1 Tax=Umbelopsis ramanniana AG TaxID=1314678 RepID=A0AAD5EDR5_UMBRA|nr:uncharacterized protein K450DRAFT_236828 [Umbelopsis ramanniana AG]KAI8580390.1 hypothetical protein K450DRAFT_236828 [Umbelopsis ramanniana AG]